MGAQVAYKLANNSVVVAWPFRGQETTRAFEYYLDSETPFELFPNIHTPTSLLRSLEGNYQPPIPCPNVKDKAWLGFSTPYGDVQEIKSPRVLLDAFGLKITPAHTRNAKEALSNWNFEDFNYWVLPVSEALDMAHDLKLAFSIVLYLQGNCSLKSLRENYKDGFSFANGLEPERSIYDAYIFDIGYSKQFDTNFIQMFASLVALSYEKYLINLDDAKSLEELQFSISDFINEFLKQVNPVFGLNYYAPFGSSMSLGNIYAFWAEKCAHNKAGVCPTCNKLFIRQRSTKKFCSDSCKVTANKEKKTSAN